MDALCQRMDRVEARLDALVAAFERHGGSVKQDGDQQATERAEVAPCVEGHSGSDDDEEPPCECDGATSRECCEAAQGALASRQLQNATDWAERAVTLGPDSARAYRVRAVVREARGDLIGARNDLSTAQSIDFDPELESKLRELCDACKGATTPSPSPTPASDRATGANSPTSTPTFEGATSAPPHPAAPMDLAALLRDPSVQAGMQAMLSDPDALRALQDSDMFRQLSGVGKP